MSVSASIPAMLVAGDGWAWADAEAAATCPPPFWGLRYVFRPVEGGGRFEVVATVADGGFLLSADPSTTSGRFPGEYVWTAVAASADAMDRRTLKTGRVQILPDPLAASAGDGRSSAERILAAIEATLEGRVTKDAESYSIEGRSISRTPIADLLRLRNVYAAEVAAKSSPGGGFISYRRMKM
ncbi:hypothetical protein [Paenirhodobacter populi]|uniref:hypothetical protein n=1 Tax=Paenirhodobacter populi TaxID=2306993 RepID=UPI000FE2C964|nr:hypothetical protein [Sinirhodobacter populi]RWR09715.1 hypothetical protein D2T32_05055 [Sinirhodobacter populi]